MNISQTIKPWGNSVGIRLPKVVTEKAGVAVGQELAISLKNGSIVLTPVKDTKQTLEQLLDDITPANLHTSVDTDHARGNEEW